MRAQPPEWDVSTNNKILELVPQTSICACRESLHSDHVCNAQRVLGKMWKKKGKQEARRRSKPKVAHTHGVRRIREGEAAALSGSLVLEIHRSDRALDSKLYVQKVSDARYNHLERTARNETTARGGSPSKPSSEAIEREATERKVGRCQAPEPERASKESVRNIGGKRITAEAQKSQSLKERKARQKPRERANARREQERARGGSRRGRAEGAGEGARAAAGFPRAKGATRLFVRKLCSLYGRPRCPATSSSTPCGERGPKHPGRKGFCTPRMGQGGNPEATQA
eukprot:6184936-Pleurochrysis_carterae.AAC.6